MSCRGRGRRKRRSLRHINHEPTPEIYGFSPELPDPRGLLEGTGRMMRHVKLRPADGIDATALRRLIRTAYADIKQQLEAELERQEQGRVRSCPTPPPEELKPTKPGTRRCCAA
jgi:hypothetical protein